MGVREGGRVVMGLKWSGGVCMCVWGGVAGRAATMCALRRRLARSPWVSFCHRL